MSSPFAPSGISQPVRGLIVGLALVAALAAAVGSMWLTLGMDLEACPLCLYQRACVFCVAGVLTIGLLTQERNAALVALAGLSPAVAAAGIGVFHVYLEATGKLECPRGIAGIGSAPQQALVAELVVVLLLLAAGWVRAFTVLLACLMGVAIALLLIQSAPKPKPLTQPEPLTRCRPPYVPVQPSKGN